MYFNAGASHGANAEPIYRNTQNRLNPDDYRYAMRALLVAMNSWITDGTAPPDLQIPRIASDDLVTPQALNFPKIPDVKLPNTCSWPGVRIMVRNFAPKASWRSNLLRSGRLFHCWFPRWIAMETKPPGIRLPIDAPLATLTGWNLRDAKVIYAGRLT